MYFNYLYFNYFTTLVVTACSVERFKAVSHLHAEQASGVRECPLCRQRHLSKMF